MLVGTDFQLYVRLFHTQGDPFTESANMQIEQLNMFALMHSNDTDTYATCKADSYSEVREIREGRRLTRSRTLHTAMMADNLHTAASVNKQRATPRQRGSGSSPRIASRQGVH
jgi:hypothetical protein